MLCQRRRWWTSIKRTLVQCRISAGNIQGGDTVYHAKPIFPTSSVDFFWKDYKQTNSPTPTAKETDSVMIFPVAMATKLRRRLGGALSVAERL